MLRLKCNPESGVDSCCIRIYLFNEKTLNSTRCEHWFSQICIYRYNKTRICNWGDYIRGSTFHGIELIGKLCRSLYLAYVDDIFQKNSAWKVRDRSLLIGSAPINFNETIGDIWKCRGTWPKKISSNWTRHRKWKRLLRGDFNFKTTLSIYRKVQLKSNLQGRNFSYSCDCVASFENRTS